jgi:outer membrane immunogenic protein
MTLSAQVTRTLLVLLLWMAAALPAAAQDWTGAYLSGHIGFSWIPEGSDNFVVFDRDLDGRFDDTITTAAGANAFSPGFCVGAAAGAQPTLGCVVDDDGLDGGGRAGYDWQRGRVVFGVVGDLAFVDHVDSVSAFSTTPAFYTFTRELEWLGGVRGRAGFGSEWVFAYGAAGLAWGGLDHRFTTSNAVNTFVESEEDMAWGYQVGGGVEFRFGGRWTAGGEYLWTSLADEDRYTVRAQGPAPATNPFILGNPNGSDLRRADAFNFGALRFVMGYRF